MADKITIPNISAPFLTQQGQVNPVWFQFLIGLLRGVEAGEVVDIAALTLLVRSLYAQTNSEVSLIAPAKQIYTGEVGAHGLQNDESLHSLVTTLLAGFMSAPDKLKLDGISIGAAVASVSGTAPIVSSGGTTPAISITAATSGAAGSMSAADKAKLDLLTYTAPTAWTPVLSFDTPGNLAITYSAQVGRIIQIGSKVSIDWCIATSAFTHTTASGFMRINGLPVAANASFPEWNGSMSWGGIPIVGFMNIIPAILTANTSIIRMVASGNNVARAQLSTGNTTSGTNVTLIGHMEYFV